MFKNLKSIFFVEEEDGNKKTASAKQTKGKSTVKATPASKPVSGGKVTDKFTNILFQALEKNNLKGFDYLEFRQSLQSLKKVQLDEETRFKSAAAMAASMGVTADDLVKSAKHYQGVLHQENQKFKQALDKQTSNQIGTKEEQLQELDKKVKEKTALIQKLTKEIEAHQKEATLIRKSIDQATGKIRKTAADFSASYQSLINQIEGDVERIKRYLNT